MNKDVEISNFIYHDGIKYKIIETEDDNKCRLCSKCLLSIVPSVYCTKTFRKDKKNVIFVEVK